MKKSKLTGTLAVGGGLKHAIVPYLIIGEEDGGYAKGDMLDANSVASMIKKNAGASAGTLGTFPFISYTRKFEDPYASPVHTNLQIGDRSKAVDNFNIMCSFYADTDPIIEPAGIYGDFNLEMRDLANGYSYLRSIGGVVKGLGCMIPENKDENVCIYNTIKGYGVIKGSFNILCSSAYLLKLQTANVTKSKALYNYTRNDIKDITGDSDIGFTRYVFFYNDPNFSRDTISNDIITRSVFFSINDKNIMECRSNGVEFDHNPFIGGLIVGSFNISSGYCNNISGDNNIGCGSFNTTNGDNNLFSGQSNITVTKNCLITGYSNVTAGGASIVGGLTNNVYKTSVSSVVAGNDNVAKGRASATFGQNNIVYNIGEAAFGNYNNSTAISTSESAPKALPKSEEDLRNGTLFSIGNGTDEDHRSNAFLVKYNGDIYVKGVNRHEISFTGEDISVNTEMLLQDIGSTLYVNTNLDESGNIVIEKGQAKRILDFIQSGSLNVIFKSGDAVAQTYVKPLNITVEGLDITFQYISPKTSLIVTTKVSPI